MSSNRRRLCRQIAILALASTGALGCATQAVPAPIISTAALGQVIIYRNGVAYFERYAPATEKEVTLRVPSERVDDFLKSLSVVDAKSGEPMPVSYPTLNTNGGVAQMTIKLPPKHNGLRITYVTESPSWKPTYRLVLADDGQAQLLAWAIVDNVSGEDWDKVRIGVGSTSALSFRYDLHSVRQVRRETLESGSLLAVAPPTGGSPHLGSKSKGRLVLNVRDDELQQMVVAQRQVEAERDRNEELAVVADGMHARGRRPGGSAGGTLSGSNAGAGAGAGRATSRKPRGRMGAGKAMPKFDGGGRRRPRPRPARAYKPRPPQPPRSHSQRLADNINQQVRSGNQRVVIEGFAKEKDSDKRAASLARANMLRDQLIANGVPADRIDAVGTGKLNAGQAAQALLVDGAEDEQPAVKDASGVRKSQQTSVDMAAETQPLGQAHFVSPEPLTIASDHSAMVSILNDRTEAQRIYFYDPISARGSKDYAFNAVRLTNPTKYTLDGGPITVYKKGQFLGEGLSEAILPGANAFIPYALDRTIIVEPTHASRDEIDKLISIQRGIVTTTIKRIHKTTLAIINRGKKAATVYVRHKVKSGYSLEAGSRKVEKLGGAHLFPLSVEAGQTLELVIEESTPKRTTIDIRQDSGVQAIALYLSKAKLSAELKKSLDEVVRRHSARYDLEERIRTMADQSRVYRTRVNELNFQLVKLRKVPQAAKLRLHLSEKMEEISEKLQANTLKISELKGDLMTSRIELQDALAELTLKNRSDEEGS